MRSISLPLVVSVLLVLAWSGAAQAQTDSTPRVAVSIAPVHSWVSQVSGDLWEPELLLSAQEDPHGALLRPSQRRHIEEADWIIWVSPQLETGLSALMGRVGENRLWTLVDDDRPAGPVEFVTHEFREAGEIFAADSGHDHGHGHGDRNGHDHGHGTDPHLWLDPENARLALAHIAERLAELDPEHAETYQANAQAAIARLNDRETEWESQLAGVEALPYVVFHDGYQYFDRRFGIPYAGAVTLNPDQLPGLRTINRMQNALSEGEVGCLFAEVQHPDRLVQTISTGFDLEILRIDAIGAEVAPGANHYNQLMDNLVNQFSQCQGT